MSSNFRIILPNNKKIKILYNNQDDKNILLNNLLNNWYNTIYAHWLGFNVRRMNLEERIKSFLERCGTFLLLGEIKYGGILSIDKRNKYHSLELPVSCVGNDIQDLYYSINNDDEDQNTLQTHGKTLILDNEIIMGNIDPDHKVKIHKSRLPKITKRYTNSQHYKINKIYSKPETVKKELYKLKNKDLADQPLSKELSEKELKQWQEKSFRNIHGENVYEYRNKVYPSRQGLINPKYPYKWAWCYVWADNTFGFNRQKYKIDDLVVQYKVDADNQSGMDKILCYSQIINGKEKYFFFDQNINKVDNKCIIKL